jgi:hypothetical protein
MYVRSLAWMRSHTCSTRGTPVGCGESGAVGLLALRTSRGQRVGAKAGRSRFQWRGHRTARGSPSTMADWRSRGAIPRLPSRPPSRSRCFSAPHRPTLRRRSPCAPCPTAHACRSPRLQERGFHDNTGLSGVDLPNVQGRTLPRRSQRRGAPRASSRGSRRAPAPPPRRTGAPRLAPSIPRPT